MSTLLLRLEGPMQSWGTQSRFTVRETDLEPSKSGVAGLLCAALGKPRDESHPDNRDKPSLVTLSGLRMGVRVDRPGVMLRDYQTVGGTHLRAESEGRNRYKVLKADGTLSKDAVVSQRFYLADASFLVGLEHHDAGLLEALLASLLRPRWQLFLGRKAFVPSVPVWAVSPGSPETNISTLPLETALADLDSFPMSEPLAVGDPPATLRVVIDARPDDPAAHETRQDHPLSFDGFKRDHTARYAKQILFDLNRRHYIGGLDDLSVTSDL